jgi:hypothetical protein
MRLWEPPICSTSYTLVMELLQVVGNSDLELVIRSTGDSLGLAVGIWGEEVLGTEPLACGVCTNSDWYQN